MPPTLPQTSFDFPKKNHFQVNRKWSFFGKNSLMNQIIFSHKNKITESQLS